MTGVQALQRLHSGLVLLPGKVETRAFDFIRQGTLAFIVNFDVVSDQVVSPCGPRRTEADILGHIKRTVATDPLVRRWHFVVDNPNIHPSESLVCYVAARDQLPADLGAVGKGGVLQSMATCGISVGPNA